MRVRRHVFASALRRALFTVLAFCLVARPVAAHQFSSRFDSPIPVTALLVGAGATVACTALLLARVGEIPAPERRLFTVASSTGDAVAAVARAGFFVLFLLVLVDGLTGPRAAAANFATQFTWALWLKGVALLSLLVGSPWRVLSPWRTLYEGLCRLEGEEVRLRPYPSVLGHWPALVGFVLLVGVVENLTRVPALPRATAVVVAGYALSMLAGGLLFGREWFERGDALAVLYDLLGRVAPVRVARDGDGRGTETGGGRWVVSARAPWRACATPVPTRTTAPFVVAMVYTVTFDGFVESPLYRSLFFGVRESLGVGASVSVVLYEVGLVGFLLAYLGVVALVERVASRGRERVGGEPNADGGGTSPGEETATLAFAATLLPIAAGYEVAHNLTYVVTTLGRLPRFLGGESVDLLFWLSVPAFWSLQVALVLLGHVVAVVAAEAVTRRRTPTRRWALRSHAPLVGLMVGYTVLSLWVVSLPVAN